MRRVILESPFAAQANAPWGLRWWWCHLNRRYARACVRHSLLLGEAPLASHLLYTQPGILNDADIVERSWGIDAGLTWGDVAQATVVYVDRGISNGMRLGIDRARREERPVEFRELKPGMLARRRAEAEAEARGEALPGASMRSMLNGFAALGDGPSYADMFWPAARGALAADPVASSHGPDVIKPATWHSRMVPRLAVKPGTVKEMVFARNCDCYLSAAGPTTRHCTCMRDGSPIFQRWEKPLS